MKKYYLPIPFVWYEMKGNQIKVLLALIHASNVYGDEEGWFYRSIDDLMRDSGVTNRRTIVSCLKKIKNRDIIEERKSNYKNSTLYRLNSEVWLNEPYQVSNSNSGKTATTKTNSNSGKTATTDSGKTATTDSGKTATTDSGKTATIHTVNKDIEKKEIVSNDDIITSSCAGACEGNTETNKSELNCVDDENMNTSNVESSYTHSFFSLSQDSLSANEINNSNEGDMKQISNVELRNASGDAGNILNSSVDTCTTSTPIVQPERPETPNQTCPDKTTTDRIHKILKGRDFYTYVGDFKAWCEKTKDVSTEMIEKIESKMAFLRENGIGKDAQWKMIDSLIFKLKNNKGSTYKGGGAPDKVDFNILREYVGKVWDAKPETKSVAIDSLCKFHETFERYMNSDLSEEQREILTSIQDNMIKACAVKRYDIGCEHKELRYDNNDKEPSDVRLDKCWSVLYAKSNIKCRDRFKELYKEKYGSDEGSLKLYEQLAKKKYGDRAYNTDIVGQLQNNW